MSRWDPRRPIEERLHEAGLPPLGRTAWLEIDLDALQSNLEALRALAAPGAPVRPVVKADAYGHGAVPVARALNEWGIDGLCVATLDEALELRAAGIDGPILVLYPVPVGGARTARACAVAVTIGDLDLFEMLLREVADDEGPPLGVHVEVETGLGRGGVAAADVARVVSRIEAAPGVVLKGVWTHLQAAEDVERTRAQLARFEHATAGIEPRHVLASAGLLVGAGGVDGIRPGLSLYGLVPDELLPDAGGAGAPGASLRPVMSLLARPVRVADLSAGWGISYGPTWVTRRPSRIATLPLGYGDGWSRQLSNRADVLVRGVRVPLVGNVAMDAIMADVTDVPGAPVTVADEFTLIGAQAGERITVDALARTRTTNSWEVVTNMARRLPRVYHSAAGLTDVRVLDERSGQWPVSNSGTATSASSRSTPS